MILSGTEAAGMEAALGKVFLIYGAFWVTVFIVLLIGVGALMKKAERGGKGHAGGPH